MSNSGQSRYANSIVVGSRDIKDAGLEITDLASLPDGFNEQESTTLTMAAIALAFGMDARELWPAMSSGATKAEALVQHLKQRGKGPGHILESLTRALEQKYLPPHLMAVFDFQDDEQDREVGEIKDKRADTTKKHLDAEVINIRVAREQALSSGDLEKAQFIKLELEDGRLENGDSVLTLFYNPDYEQLLELGGVNPTDIQVNDPDLITQAIANKRLELMKIQATVQNYKERAMADNALAALEALEKLYNKPQVPNVDTIGQDTAPVKKTGLSPDTAADMNTEGATTIDNALKALKRIFGK